MARVLVSGLINIETTLRIDGFPLYYNPVNYPFFGIESTVSGVGYNAAKALTRLGDEVLLLSLIGCDIGARQVEEGLLNDNISGEHVLSKLEQTPQSVILYDDSGRRQIYVDLKDVQEQIYPEDDYRPIMATCDWLVLCNVNFSRPMLFAGQTAGKPIATDVHAIDNLEDDYNRDFMAAANVLFMSDERLPILAEDWARQVMRRYGPEIIVIGLGKHGAIIHTREDGRSQHFPAVYTRPVVNTIGAGDALFSAFVHCYAQSGNPAQAMKKAMLFASYKIGVSSAADGFLNDEELDRLYRNAF